MGLAASMKCKGRERWDRDARGQTPDVEMFEERPVIILHTQAKLAVDHFRLHAREDRLVAFEDDRLFLAHCDLNSPGTLERDGMERRDRPGFCFRTRWRGETCRQECRQSQTGPN